MRWHLSISIHAPREGRDALYAYRENLDDISIHAPREGRDYGIFQDLRLQRISIHAPREGRDRWPLKNGKEDLHFNPRAPRGARRQTLMLSEMGLLFQSTRPARGATGKCSGNVRGDDISIHAPREGRDYHSLAAWRQGDDFNPRAPRGARRFRNGLIPSPFPFQSTRPARGATLDAVEHDGIHDISIHAPREGRDSKSEQISLHIFAKKAWIPDIFAQNAAFQSVLPLADRQKLLYLRCEPLRKFLRAFASHYKIIGSSGR